MIGALAIFAIGAFFLVGAFLFLHHNLDPKNRAATKEIVTGGPSATRGVRGGEKPEHAR